MSHECTGDGRYGAAFLLYYRFLHWVAHHWLQCKEKFERNIHAEGELSHSLKKLYQAVRQFTNDIDTQMAAKRLASNGMGCGPEESDGQAPETCALLDPSDVHAQAQVAYSTKTNLSCDILLADRSIG